MTIEFRNAGVVFPRQAVVKEVAMPGTYEWEKGTTIKTKIVLTPGENSLKDVVAIQRGSDKPFIVEGPNINQNSMCKKFGIKWSCPEKQAKFSRS